MMASETALAGRSKRLENARPIKCQICASETTPGLDLGHQPVGDLVRFRGQLNRPETFYPMQLHHCPTCGLTQLGYIVNPKVVYKHFPFVSGTTKTATDHLQSLPPRLVADLDLAKDSFAVDIGSNDGTLLKAYIPHGVRFLGVDPSGDPVRIAREQGIDTLHAFFNEANASHILNHYQPADAITACGVFAHIADLAGIMRGIKMLLAPGGVFASDNQYWLDMVERLHYDNIFHQHLRYYSVKPLMNMFARYDMEIIDVERSEVYGGSIRVFASHVGAREISPRVRELMQLEEQAGLYQPATNAKFARDVEARKMQFFDTIWEYKKSGAKIIGIGAPAKASTVCNYCKLGPNLVDYITEVNPMRTGVYLPGMHIPIVDEKQMFEDAQPADVAILFAWNYRDEIEPKLRRRGYKGDIIYP